MRASVLQFTMHENRVRSTYLFTNALDGRYAIGNAFDCANSSDVHEVVVVAVIANKIFG